jgi:hypothetical protein
MRILVATALAVSFLATPVFAGDLPLPAGKPAGVKAAQYEQDNTIFFIVGGAAIVAGIVILANNNGSKNITPGTTPVSPSTSTTT